MPREPTSTWGWQLYGVLLIVSTVITVIVLPADFLLLVTTLDPGFTLYFVLVLLVFIVKLFHVTACYLLYCNTTNRQYYLLWVGIGLVVISLTLILLIVEILILTQSVVAILTNPFAIDFFFLTLTGGLALGLGCGACVSGDSSYAYSYVMPPREHVLQPFPQSWKQPATELAQQPFTFYVPN